MTLHPQAQAICDAIAAAPPMELSDATLAEQRASFGALMLFAGPVADGVATSDHEIAGVACRVHRPTGDDAARPVVVLYHGGGFTIGTAREFDPVGARVAAEADAVVVVPDYRLAPEHRFPAAAEDALCALRWASENADVLGVDANRIAVGGDSAGGNLAAVVAQQRPVPIRFQLLIYPATDMTQSFPSQKENAAGPVLTEQAMEWFIGHYMPNK